MNTTASQTPNYLVWSIINTVLSLIGCCFTVCFPAIGTGIAAIVFSTKVKSHLAAGDTAAAEKASKNAKLWNWITTGMLIFAFLCWLGYVMLVGFGAWLEAMGQMSSSF